MGQMWRAGFLGNEDVLGTPEVHESGFCRVKLGNGPVLFGKLLSGSSATHMSEGLNAPGHMSISLSNKDGEGSDSMRT